MADSKKLKEQRDRFLAFAFASADLFLEVAESGTIKYATGAAKAITGLDEEKLIGKKWLDLFSAQDHAQLLGLRKNATPGQRCGPVLITMDKNISNRQGVFSAIKMPENTAYYISLSLSNELMDRLGYPSAPPAKFDDSAYGKGTIGPEEKFDDSQYGQGTVDKKKDFDDSAYGKTALAPEEGFDDSQYGQGTVANDPKFDDSQYGKGTVGPEQKFDDSLYGQGGVEKEKDFDDSLYGKGTLGKDEGFDDSQYGQNLSEPEKKKEAFDDSIYGQSFLAAEEDTFDDSIYGKTEFLEEAAAVFEFAATQNKEAKVTVYDFGFTKTVDEKNWAEAMGEITELLRASSIGGKAAAEVAAGQFTFIHDSTLDADDLNKKIAAAWAARGFSEDQIEFKTIDADISDDPQKSARALGYAINELEEKGADFEMGSLSAGFETHVNANLDRRKELHEIIKRSDFSFNFQPVIDLKNKEVLHYEILCRFKTGDVRDWIGFAEDTNMIVDLDLAICDRVFQYIKHKAGGTRTKFAVNISRHSAENAKFHEEMAERLTKYNDIGSRLLLEITDSSRIKNRDLARKFLEIARGLGFQIALDDFTGGPNSLGLIESLGLHFVIINSKHTRRLLKSPGDVAMITNLAKACHGVGTKVIAKHIAEQEQAARLLEIGVRYGQGFLFSEPQPKPEYIPL